MKHFFHTIKKGVSGVASAKSGFAMLFTVLIVSIILAIGLGISDVTYKQTILSNLARDSQLAFYQADSGVECGMYYDLTAGQLPRGTTVDQAPQTFACGDSTVTLDSGSSSADHFVYTEQDLSSSNQPCFSIIFDKTDEVKNSVSSHGLSTCASTPQQVERALMVRY